jgi:hypothetical protein
MYYFQYKEITLGRNQMQVTELKWLRILSFNEIALKRKFSSYCPTDGN